MQSDLKRSVFGANALRRIIIYGIMTLILGAAQCAFFPTLNVCPETPDLIMGMLLAIALLDDPKSAAVTAICAGFFMDAIGGLGFALSPVIYFVYVVIISTFSGKVLKSFPSYLLLLIPTLIYRAAATYLCISLTDGAFATLWVFEKIILPEAIVTAIFSLPIYFIVKLCSRAFETHGRFTF